jgi:hypothetical protein
MLRDEACLFHVVLLALSLVLQGLNALMLTRREHFFEAQKTALVHHASGLCNPVFLTYAHRVSMSETIQVTRFNILRFLIALSVDADRWLVGP